MRLKLQTSQTDALRTTLNSIVSLRKYCILRFTSTHLNIVSASLSEPQVWCKLSTGIFDVYEIESIRENVISFEINIDQLYQVLKNFDKSNSQQLTIRLQRKQATGEESSSRSALLTLFYNEFNSNHTFRIPIRLLKKESDERISEPELSNVDLLMKLPNDISSLFKRIDRYKKSDMLRILGTKNGYLGLSIKQDDLKVTLSWNDKLQVQQDECDSINKDVDDLIGINVKLKDWRLGCKIVELCKNVVFIISENEAMVLHCYLDETEDCEIVYYISGIDD